MKEYKDMNECIDKVKLNIFQVLADITPFILMINLTISAVLYMHWKNAPYGISEGGLWQDEPRGLAAHVDAEDPL